MKKFNMKKDKLLIDLVKKHPVLYNPSDSNFKNCIVKHMVWEKISLIMDIAVPDLKRRWKHFRDHFHKKQKAENAGLATVHTWDYKPHLQFLVQYSSYKDKVKNNRKDSKDIEGDLDSRAEHLVEEATLQDSTAQDSVKERIEDSKKDFDDATLEINERAETEEFKSEQVQSDFVDHEVVPGLESVLEEIPMKKRKKMDTLVAVLEKRLAKRFRFDAPKAEKSPTHKFFESMADIVAQFPPHLVAETRLKVCQLVNEMEMKNLSEQEFL